MPGVLVGDLGQIAAAMRERRERYGLTYYVFADAQAEQLAPLARLLRDV
jgi:hypothetical protein